MITFIRFPAINRATHYKVLTYPILLLVHGSSSISRPSLLRNDALLAPMAKKHHNDEGMGRKEGKSDDVKFTTATPAVAEVLNCSSDVLLATAGKRRR